ncbi:MAG: tetratricopeptide repeat protein [Breznakibacter sp.]|nr:tetratricopeptide repeat protein [Breznakibacter sp.]
MRSLFIQILMLLFCLAGHSKANGKQFPQPCCEALEAMLYYDFGKAETILQSIEKKEHDHLALPYLKQYKHFLAYLANDNQAQYEAFIKAHSQAMEALQTDPSGWHLVFSSNMLLQKSLVEFSRGNHFQGAIALYRSYNAFREIEPNNANTLWQLKLRGIFNILWDRIPDNLRFISNLAGYKGDYYMGIRQLVAYNDKMLSPGLADESKIILLYVHQLFQQDNEDLVELFEETLSENNPPLTHFLYSGILSRLSHGHKALEILQTVPKNTLTRFPLLQYQHARILLNAGYIDESKAEMSQFIRQYRGDSFCNDAYLQMSRICYLNNEGDEAAEWSLKCLGKQPANTAIDRQAIEECRLFNQWQPTLLRARLYFDHGDYEKALEWVSKPINMQQAQIEQQYRKGRIAHKKGEWAAAIQWYNRAIGLASKDARYYGPYAALFCAEIKIAAKEYQEASRYLAMARKLNTGEYKQDIEFKIKNYQKQFK